MTEEERLAARRMQEAFGDIEFQMDIAPNLGYKGPIDASKARLRKATPESTAAGLRGFHVRPGTEGDDPEPHMGVTVEDDTVNVVGADNANSMTWAHEYRHRQSPGLSERDNRIEDAVNAQNDREWDQAVEGWRNWMGREGVDMTPKQAERDLRKIIDADISSDLILLMDD